MYNEEHCRHLFNNGMLKYNLINVTLFQPIKKPVKAGQILQPTSSKISTFQN